MRVMRVNPNLRRDQVLIASWVARVRYRSGQILTSLLSSQTLTCIKNALMDGWMRGMAGKEVLGYMGPCPPVGIQRYVFLLFRQEASTIAVDPPSARNNFSTREFADRNRLGLPVAAVYFNAHKEPASRRY